MLRLLLLVPTTTRQR